MASLLLHPRILANKSSLSLYCLPCLDQFHVKQEEELVLTFDLLLSICLRFFWLFFVPLHIQFFLKNYKSESLNYEPGSLYNIEVELYRCFLFYNEFHLPQIADRCRCLKRVLKPV